MNHYYLGPFQQTMIDGQSGFAPPDGAVGCVDLRSLPQHATQPFGFFVLPDDRLAGNADYDLLCMGDFRNEIPSNAAINGWRSRLNITEGMVSTSFCDLLWDTLTLAADPTGDDRVRPLMPTMNGVYELHVGGHSLVKSRRLNASLSSGDLLDRAIWAKTRAVVRMDLLECRLQSLRGEMISPHTGSPDFDYHRRVLDAACGKYGVDGDELRPAGWPANEGRLPHSTTIAESFNKADSDILGPDLTWSELGTVDWDIVSNVAELIDIGGTSYASRADSDLSSVEHYSQVKILTVPSTHGGVICRKDGTATMTYYHADYLVSNTWRSFKRVASTFTAIGANTNSLTLVSGDVVKIAANGSSISRYRNGSLQNTATDTAISSGLRCGISGGTVGVRLDDFEAGDLAATGNPHYYYQQQMIAG